MPINCRAETISTSGMFRDAFGRWRCLVPAAAFYEWKVIEGRQAALCHCPGRRGVMALGGIWESRRAPDGENVRTFAITTTLPNAEIVPLHNRMPFVIDRADWPASLGEEEADPVELLRPAPDGTRRAWPVS